MPTPRRKPELGAGLGPAVVPYSRNNEDNPLVSMLDPNAQQQALAFLGKNQGAPDGSNVAPPPSGGQGLPPTGMDGGTLDAPGANDSGMFSDQDLQAMQQSPNQGGPPQDPQVAQVIAALNDPNTPPDMKQRIQTMLSLSARRRLAGLNS